VYHAHRASPPVRMGVLKKMKCDMVLSHSQKPEANATGVATQFWMTPQKSEAHANGVVLSHSQKPHAHARSCRSNLGMVTSDCNK
jgi:hypothetical protein